jgi:hypothetical protein
MIGFDISFKVYYTPGHRSGMQKLLGVVSTGLADQLSETRKNASKLNF